MAVDTHNNGEDYVADIAPDGDVVFIVGRENVRLRVHSLILRSASKIFGAMFGPNWNEGQRFSKDLPTEVSLPEDDAEAMRAIFCVIHVRDDLVPEHLTTEKKFQIAIKVDKYDLTIALKFASSVWLNLPSRAPLGVTSIEQTKHLMAAAFLFGNTNMFKRHTEMLILDYGGSYLSLFKEERITQVIPSKIFYLLEERRTRLRAELCQLLDSGKKEICECGWGKSWNENYQALLVKYWPVEMLSVPISEIINRMEATYVADSNGGRKYCRDDGHGGSIYHYPTAYHETPRKELIAMKVFTGISIEAVRTLDTMTELIADLKMWDSSVQCLANIQAQPN